MRPEFLVASGVVTLALSGCGSSWDIRKEDELPVGCAESFFYADADGDGWGDADSAPEVLCSADVERGLTASNGRDCDDGTASITGLVGNTCPDGLVSTPDGIPAPHGGAVFDQAEFAWVYGEAGPVLRHSAGVTSCEGWGATVDQVKQGSLATFSSQPELEAVVDELEAAVSAGTGAFAAFVGIEWDGTAVDNGAWSFVDDSADGLIEQAPDLNWCDTEPLPTDFFPLLNPEDPEHVPAINAQLGELRLALVRQESGTWCLGLPYHAIPSDIWEDLQAGTANLNDPVVAEVSRYTTSDAHLLCKRVKPDPANYVHFSE